MFSNDLVFSIQMLNRSTNRDAHTKHSWTVSHSPLPVLKERSGSSSGLKRCNPFSPSANVYPPIAWATRRELLRDLPSPGGTRRSRCWVWKVPTIWHGRNSRTCSSRSTVRGTSFKSSNLNYGTTRWWAPTLSSTPTVFMSWHACVRTW